MKSFLKPYSILFILYLFNLNIASSQEDSNNKDVLRLKKNAIYGSVGMGVMVFTGSAYYERIIGKGTTNTEVFLRIGTLGVEGARTGNNLAFDAGLLLGPWNNWLVGTQNNWLLELAAGWHPKQDDQSDLKPFGGSFAGRYQKPQGIFIFRFGMGYPEALFISMGFCF